MNERIDYLSKALWSGSIETFQEVETIRLILLNMKITVAKMSSNPDARALDRVSDIIEEAILKLEKRTLEVRDVAKEIGKLNRED